MQAPVFTPSRQAYLTAATPLPLGAYVPLGERSPRDLLTRLGGTRPFLLESARTATGLARYSFLGADPAMTLVSHGAQVHVRQKNGTASTHTDHPLTMLRQEMARWQTPRPDGFPPFFGGFAGVLSYDLARRIERLPEFCEDDLNLPEMDLSLADLVVTADHEKSRLWVTWLPDPDERGFLSAEERYVRGRGRIEAVFSRLLEEPPAVSKPGAKAGAATSGMDRKTFTNMVRKARQYIAAGDIFQANLSQRFSAPAKGVDPWQLYDVLSGINPSPFACYFDHGDYQVVSSSPERLVSLADGVVQSRPIAGTRPRGMDSKADTESGEALLASAKERAEHLMLVDLMRNDLGRVCHYGSVKVSEFMTTERYSHVIHIVSNVIGQLGPGKDAVSLIRAVFPGGTITGAPKVRCMEVIEELEPVRRGLYTGSAGYLAASGDMDLNILIRTIVMQDNVAYFQTGAGIVADSDPEAEYEETLHKAAAMNRALERVGQGVTKPAAALEAAV